MQKQIRIVIEYLVDSQPICRYEKELTIEDGVQQVTLTVIYKIINEYFERFPNLDSRVLIVNNGRYCGRLMAEGFDSEDSQITQQKEVRIMLEPIKNFARLAAQVESVGKQLDELSKPDNLGPQKQEAPSSKNITIGVLYADPLPKENADGVAETNLETVSYEHEIRKIIRFARVMSCLKQTKQVSLQSMPATMSNLSQLLQNSIQTNFLHISCHGTKESLIFEGEELCDINRISIPEFEGALKRAGCRLHCLVIMACHSWKFAEAAIKFCDFVVGIDEKFEVADNAAQLFSERFYEGVLKGFSYQKSFLQAVQYVNENFEPCSCDPDNRGINKLFPCRNIHNQVTCKCPQGNTKNRHNEDCKITRINLRGCIPKSTGGRYWLCCCACTHDESKKFKSAKNHDSITVKINQVPESIATDHSNESQSSSIPMPEGRNYFTPALQLMDMKKLINEKSKQVITLFGGKGSGKSCFLKKVVGYISRRIFEQEGSRGHYPLYKDWVYLDLKHYESLLHFQASCSIIRNGKTYHTLPDVLEYLKQQRCIVVLDHCTKLAADSPQQFKKVIQSQFCQGLSQDSKVIVAVDTEERTQWMKPAFSAWFEFRLKQDQLLNIFISITRDYSYKTEKYQEPVKQLKASLPRDLNHLVAFFSNLPREIISNRQTLLETLQKEADKLKQQQAQIDKAIEEAKGAKDSKQRKLLLFLAIFRGKLSIADLQGHQHYLGSHQLEQAFNSLLSLEGPAKYNALIEKAEDNDYFEATKLLLKCFEDCVIWILQDYCPSSEQPFSVSPLLSARTDKQSNFPFSSVFNKAKFNQLAETLIEHTRDIGRSKRVCFDSKQGMEELAKLRRLLVRIPLVKHLIGSLVKSEFIYKVLHAFEKTHFGQNSNRSITDAFEICFSLMFTRAEQRARLRKEWKVVGKYLEPSLPSDGSRYKYGYLRSFANLQIEYLISTKFLKQPVDWGLYAASIRSVAENYERLRDQLGRQPKLRHAICFGSAVLNGCTLLDSTIIGDAICKLKNRKQHSLICKIKYYQCQFALQKDVKKTSDYEAYRIMLSQIEDDLKHELDREEVRQLRYLIGEELANIRSSFVKILTSCPLSASNKIPRKIDVQPIKYLDEIRKGSQLRNCSTSIESEMLTLSSLEKTLSSGFRIVCLRLDLTNSGEIQFESEDRLGGSIRKPLYALVQLSFEQVGVLVVCGVNTSLLLDKVRPQHLIIVDLREEKEESLQDADQRRRIQEEYCKHFLAELLKGLVLPKQQHLVDCRISESLDLACHQATLKASRIMQPGQKIRKYIEVKNVSKSSKDLFEQKDARLDLQKRPELIASPKKKDLGFTQAILEATPES